MAVGSSWRARWWLPWARPTIPTALLVPSASKWSSSPSLWLPQAAKLGLQEWNLGMSSFVISSTYSSKTPFLFCLFLLNSQCESKCKLVMELYMWCPPQSGMTDFRGLKTKSGGSSRPQTILSNKIIGGALDSCSEGQAYLEIWVLVYVAWAFKIISFFCIIGVGKQTKVGLIPMFVKKSYWHAPHPFVCLSKAAVGTTVAEKQWWGPYGSRSLRRYLQCGLLGGNLPEPAV